MWTELLSGDGGSIVVEPDDPTTVLVCDKFGAIFRFVAGVGFGGQITTNFTFCESEGDPRISLIAPLVTDGVDDTLYFGTWRLFTSTDEGELWSPCTEQDLTKGGTDVLAAIAVSPANSRVIYTGSVQGRAMLSTDAGTSWTDITGSLPNRSITSITIDPDSPSTAYITLSGFFADHVFETNDMGSSWVDISSGLPDLPVNTLLIDPLESGTLYLGNDIGVYRSIEGGSWQPFDTGLPPVIVNALVANKSGLIQAGTYGRGVYQIKGN